MVAAVMVAVGLAMNRTAQRVGYDVARFSGVSMTAATQRCVVRIALGVYLFVHYAALLPYASELFSRDGAMHFGIIVLADFADLTLGILLVHAYTLDPAWLARRTGAVRTSLTARTPLAVGNLR